MPRRNEAIPGVKKVEYKPCESKQRPSDEPAWGIGVDNAGVVTPPDYDGRIAIMSPNSNSAITIGRRTFSERRSKDANALMKASVFHLYQDRAAALTAKIGAVSYLRARRLQAITSQIDKHQQ